MKNGKPAAMPSQVVVSVAQRRFLSEPLDEPAVTGSPARQSPEMKHQQVPWRLQNESNPGSRWHIYFHDDDVLGMVEAGESR
jgi:hypothetical protein